MQAKESIELVEKPVILRELLKTQRPALVNAALETLFTSSWSSKIEIEEIVCSKILNGIFKNIEKDLAQDRPKKQDFHLTRYYLRAFQRDKDLRQNFYAQLSILGAARIVANHYFSHAFPRSSEDFQSQFARVQRIFDLAIIHLSSWWGNIYQALRQKDQQLIDELKLVKNDLQKQLNVTYQMVKESPVGAVDCDSQLQVVHWNRMAARLTGFNPPDILRKEISDIFYGKSREIFQKKIRSNREWISNLQLNIIQKSREYFPASVSISKIKKPSPGNISYVISFQDISDQVKFSSQIQTIDKLTAISRLTSAMMHDIRNPLNTIGLSADILKDLLEKEIGAVPPSIEALADKIQGQIHQLTQNLNHYLMYTHLTELSMEAVNLSQNLDTFIQDVRYEAAIKKISIEYQRSRRDYRILADWLQLKRVFMNLVRNGMDVLPEGGKMKVRIFRRRNRVLVAFTDYGPGIDASRLQKIFDPFFTTKESGEGLGLFIAREIIKAHRGRITCTSKLGLGTTFSTSFPVYEKFQHKEKEDAIGTHHR
ncbi:hypothetical protein A2V82_07560 [candidate division KSB1 bacterium RBG_16_48_16]|nr:MAG: hypothetical protein A2V82_07560 [candidate division KSB1 bacterium RBG_16_48_16]